MPDKTPKIEDIPSYEEFRDAIGMDAMSFMHDMVSPDNPDEHGDEGEESTEPSQ